MALNLARATKLFVSTVQSATAGSHSSSNTWEIPPLDGYSFSQDPETQTITLNEAGQKPVRGQKLFNVALNPAEISFTTYVRPYDDGGTAVSCVELPLWEALVGDGTSPSITTATVGTNVKYNATGDYLEANFKNSNKHELLKIYLFFQLDNTTYRINDFAINSAEFDFSIDGIAQVTWTGQGATITEVDTSTWVATTNYLAANGIANNSNNALFIKNKLSSIALSKVTGLTSGYAAQQYTTAVNANNLANLDGASTYTVQVAVDGGSAQTVTIDSSTGYWNGATVTAGDIIAEMNYQLTGCVVYVGTTGTEAGHLIFKSTNAGTASIIDVTAGATDLLGVLEAGNTKSTLDETNGTGTGTPTIFNVPITGGTLTIENNVTYLTPEELGTVNTPIGSFTGTRSISGSVTAYLNTGATNTSGLLADLLADTDEVTQEFIMTMSMGGASNETRVDFVMNHAALVIPSISVEDVLSTEIGFTALGENIDLADELVVRYYAEAQA